ncbi:TIR domain-containing protein [Marinifilum fragile]|uniref:TIR domain-containing protein n=1 Tax=Marinifilum fragile TaxID=570161 RepID=UPI002AA914E4|nr:TIR domain-containing protein [Marinifilum fragile]
MKTIYHKPKIFIASTSEAIEYTKALVCLLEHEDLDITPWSLYFENGFESTINQLLNIDEYDFGIVIFTPDDETKSRDRNYDTPRDNVVFELGLLLGTLGKERVFPIIPRNSKLKLPSDLLGTNPFLFYYSDKDKSFDDRMKAMKEASYRISSRISQLGSRNKLVLHDKILFNSEENKLCFKIAFTGPDSVLNLNIAAHLLRIKKEPDGKNSQNWEKLKLTTRLAPEVRCSWQFAHKFNYESSIVRDGKEESVIIKSPLLKLHENKEKLTIEDLWKLDKCKIRIDLNGYLSSTMKPIFASKEYWLSDVEIGTFKRFYEIDKTGNIDKKSIDWQSFKEIITYTKNGS